MEEPHQPPRRHGSSFAIAASVFLALYIFFPVPFIAPFIRNMDSTPGWIVHILEVAFWPQEKLYNCFPPYTKLIDLQFKLLGIH